jgi:hypothetical protein
MRTLAATALATALLTSTASAQGPPGPRGGPPETPESFADRLLAFDQDRDGKLTRAELTDARLSRVFDRADADKDGVVTRAELTALATRELADDRNAPGPGFGGPPGGFGGPPGGPMGGPPRPGEVLPPMLRQRLGLSAEQSQQLDDLQKDVDARLAKILTTEQRDQLRSMRGPGGPGGPGGRGFGGPGGPPPGGPPPDRPR